MTSTTPKPTVNTAREHSEGDLWSLEVEAELEESDRQAGHEYLPMDVYVDRGTMQEHFQMSSIRTRWARAHPTAV